MARVHNNKHLTTPPNTRHFIQQRLKHVAKKKKKTSAAESIRKKRTGATIDWASTTSPVIPSATCSRIIKELCPQEDTKVSAQAKEAIQEAAEAYLVELFHKSNVLRSHAGRATLMTQDMRLASLMARPFNYTVEK